ncbi:hypothetical protein HK101_009312 [Irineochytrium annulatum]|nr:hypothetical protein HK101_009312 [Irineochytrium annulatum]
MADLEEESDFSEDDFGPSTLTIFDRARLWWTENIVQKQKLHQFYGLLLATLVVLSCWAAISGTSEGKRPGGSNPDKIFDDSARDLPNDWTQIRLPSHVVPIDYGVEIDTDIERFSFSGDVLISLNLTGPTKVIVVHAADLTTKNPVMWFDHINGTSVKPSSVRVDDKLEFVVLTFDRPLKASSQWLLTMDFSGNLTDSLRGYYRSSYLSDNGSKKYIATTQFQPGDARRAFPCFDEPGMKAAFQLNMTIPSGSGYHALSNMPVVQDLRTGSTRKFVFEKTKRMSTYLVAFVVSDFEYQEMTTDSDVIVRVYTQPGKKNLGKYALKAGTAILEFFERTFRINYPLPKLDLISLPDFAAGAMENWGLITYRDTALLYDENSSAAKDKQRVASVIAHEGYATFMEYKGVDSFEKDWRLSDQFLYMDLMRAMDTDSSRFTHTVALEVNSPDEIEEIFDDISYAKGASLLRMLEAWLNTAADRNYFFLRIEAYLNKYAYSNAETKNLWEELDKPGLELGKVMNSWTSQPGYPVVVVRDDGLTDGGFTVQQERFIISREVAADLNFTRPPQFLSQNEPSALEIIEVNATEQHWNIPMLIRRFDVSGTAKGSTYFTTLDSKEEVPLDGPVVMLNYGRKGLYRVMYPEHLWKLYIKWVKKGDVFGPVERAGLISDAFALNWAGYIKDVRIPLEFTKALSHELDFVVWKHALHELGNLDDILCLDHSYGLFEEYQREIFTPIARSLGWNETDDDVSVHHGRALLRSEILSEAIALNIPEFTKQALEYFHTIKDSMRHHDGLKALSFEEAQAKLTLAPGVLNVVWDAGVIWGTDGDYDFVLEAYENATFAVDKERLLHALASARKPYQIRQTLEMTLNGKVRRQDITKLIFLVADLYGPTHIQVWTFLLDRWKEFTSMWTGGWNPVNGMLKNLVSVFAETSLIDEAEKLFLHGGGGPDFFVPPLADKAIKKGLEISKTRVAWLRRSGPALYEWLKSNVEDKKTELLK